MVNVSEFNSSDPSSFPGRAEFNLLFNVDIVNPLLKNKTGKDRRPHFVVVVVWKALIVGVCMVVAWGRKSYLAPVEISSSVFLIQFKDGGHRVSLRLHLFVSDVDPGKDDFKCKNVCAKTFLLVPQGWKGSP